MFDLIINYNSTVLYMCAIITSNKCFFASAMYCTLFYCGIFLGWNINPALSNNIPKDFHICHLWPRTGNTVGILQWGIEWRWIQEAGLRIHAMFDGFGSDPNFKLKSEDKKRDQLFFLKYTVQCHEILWPRLQYVYWKFKWLKPFLFALFLDWVNAGSYLGIESSWALSWIALSQA